MPSRCNTSSREGRASSTSRVRAQLDRSTLVLSLEPLRVDVVLIDVWAGVELIVAVEGDRSVAGDSEAEGGTAWGVKITLELVSIKHPSQ